MSATNTQPGPRHNWKLTPLHRTKSVSAPTDNLSTSENVREGAAVMLILFLTYAVVYVALKALILLGWHA
ncbi:hypothetical protein RCF19_19020 [Rhodococcus qingshengii]